MLKVKNNRLFPLAYPFYGAVGSVSDTGFHGCSRLLSTGAAALDQAPPPRRREWLTPGRQQLIVIVVAALTYLVALVSPPVLMDDVDAAESLQAKTMLVSGDWVTQRLNGVPYLEKAPLKYWLTAGLYSILGVHDWVSRIPTAVAAILLCWLVVCMGQWADKNSLAGFYGGLVLATSIGLYLFTRVVIPDVILTLLIACSLWCLARLLEEDEASSRKWALAMYAAAALAFLTKGFIGLVFPAGIAFVYLAVTGKLSDRAVWSRLRLLPGMLLFLLIAAPWHILAILHNPPYFDFSMHVGSGFGGRYRGFFWFYFINEQVLRFLNERWPRDYNTVPRFWFWAFHIFWFFPWTLYLPALARVNFKPSDRAGRLRILATCWIAVIMVFFTFSTTQEYYSMPIYPAFALLLGWAMTTDSKWLRVGSKFAGTVAFVAAVAIIVILAKVWRLPTPGDIFTALDQHPDLYTLSLGHMADLTLVAFAYLRPPLLLAGIALLVGGLGAFVLKRQRTYFALVVMLVLFFQAARLALITFDPYLSSYDVAQKLNQLPRGTVIVCGKYNPLSSIFFYSRDGALQNDGDLDILEYGALAPGAPKIVVSDEEMKRLWDSPQRVYIVAKAPHIQHLHDVLGRNLSQPILKSGDKFLFANQPRVNI